MIFKKHVENKSFFGRLHNIEGTVLDIKEGKCARVSTIGVIEGSSEMGLTQ